jgi:hypothetical protein
VATALQLVERRLAEPRRVEARVAENAIGEAAHLVVQQPIPLVHVVEERREIGAADLVDAERIRPPHEQLAIGINLQARGFTDVHVTVDQHQCASPSMGRGVEAC